MRGLLVALVLLAVALVRAWLDEDAGIRAWIHLREDVARSERATVELRTQIEALREEEERLRSDPFALERAIREDLDLVRPGEILVRIPDAPDRSAPLP